MKQKKTVFITGCNGTLGKKLVSYFLKKKFNVIGTKRNLNSQHQKSKNLKIFKLDMLNDSDFKKLVNNLNKTNTKIDVLINNSAVPSGSLTEMTSIKSLKNVFEINFFSQIKLIQNLLRFIKKSKNGSIINIGSISGLIAEKGFLSYGTSKCAFMFASKIMAKEFERYNIRVNAIAPSVFKSKMAKKMDKRIKQKFLENSSTKKEIKLKSVIDLIDSLSSKDSTKINGQVIRLDNDLKL
jgi:3-oxoacyl-[acyl-carrier protein] reductase